METPSFQSRCDYQNGILNETPAHLILAPKKNLISKTLSLQHRSTVSPSSSTGIRTLDFNYYPSIERYFQQNSQESQEILLIRTPYRRLTAHLAPEKESTILHNIPKKHIDFLASPETKQEEQISFSQEHSLTDQKYKDIEAFSSKKKLKPMKQFKQPLSFVDKYRQMKGFQMYRDREIHGFIDNFSQNFKYQEIDADCSTDEETLKEHTRFITESIADELMKIQSLE